MRYIPINSHCNFSFSVLESLPSLIYGFLPFVSEKKFAWFPELYRFDWNLRSFILAFIIYRQREENYELLWERKNSKVLPGVYWIVCWWSVQKECALSLWFTILSEKMGRSILILSKNALLHTLPNSLKVFRPYVGSNYAYRKNAR